MVKFWQKRACNYVHPFRRENTRGFRRKTINLHVELVSDEKVRITAAALHAEESGDKESDDHPDSY